MPKPDVSDQRIPQILNAAALVFSENGVDKASMAQIAKSAKLSKAAIYHYFTSKDEMIEALVRHLFEKDQADIMGLIKSTESAGKRLKVYAENLVQLLDNNSSLLPMLAECRVLALRNRKIKDVLKGYFQGYVSAFTTIIEQGLESSEFRSHIDSKDAALSLAALIEGAVLISQSLDKQLHEVMSITVALFIDGLVN